MITRVYDFTAEERSALRESWRGKKLLAYFKAYGGSYDFCQFFRLEYETVQGWMFLLNSTLVICSNGTLPAEEAADFIRMHLPFRVECPQNMLAALREIPNYQQLRRTLFSLKPLPVSETFCEADVEFNPRLSDVYDILQEGFPNLTDYPLWLTDTSHRCRHGVSHVLTYKGSTTVTIVFDQNNSVMIGQVATRSVSRGSGYARDFLKWLSAWLGGMGKEAVLYALDVRRSFYQEIGFEEVETEYVLERQDVQKEDTQKGALQ
ncbi:MAG: N-acetyltransferase [Ruminococcus sp.]|nr:N-acetyltransferase [Ruminococcus sp.]